MMNLKGQRQYGKSENRMKSEDRMELLMLAVIIIIAIVFWFVYSFGFDVRREESAIALNLIKQTIGG